MICLSSTRAHLHLNTGVELYYEYYQHEDPDAPTLVFVHGGGGWGDHWQLQLPHFAPLTSVLVCDLRGHGRSSIPCGRYAIETFVDDLQDLLTQLRIERPILVGHSLGGTIALRYAFDFPDQVVGITIIDAGCGAGPITRAAYRDLVVARVHDYAAAQASGQRYHTSPHSGRAEFVQAVLAATPAPPAAVIHATHYGILTHNNAAAAAFLTCPLLVLGACDMDYWPTIESWLHYAPHAQLIGIAHSAHYLMLEQPTRVNAALEQFWQAVGTGQVIEEPRVTPAGVLPAALV